MPKKNSSEKEKQLLDIIEKAKKDLLKLQGELKTEIGTLACKYSLHKLDLKVLDTEFKELSKKHQLAP
jgi:hypothetical protein